MKELSSFPAPHYYRRYPHVHQRKDRRKTPFRCHPVVSGRVCPPRPAKFWAYCLAPSCRRLRQCFQPAPTSSPLPSLTQIQFHRFGLTPPSVRRLRDEHSWRNYNFLQKGFVPELQYLHCCLAAVISASAPHQSHSGGLRRLQRCCRRHDNDSLTHVSALHQRKLLR